LSRQHCALEAIYCLPAHAETSHETGDAAERQRQCATQVGISKEVLDAVRGKVKSKLAGMSRDFVDSLDL
jgi:hypothetical protein